MTHVAEIPEAEASGALAATYRDIRAVTGVGMVNLIWRHMATIPNALDWAWGSVRPPFVSGRIAGESAALIAALDLPEVAPITAEAFPVAGVGEPALNTIRAIIETLFPVIDSTAKVPDVIEDMVQRGELGLKTGKGFYPWTDESAAALRGRVSEALATIERLSQGG